MTTFYYCSVNHQSVFRLPSSVHTKPLQCSYKEYKISCEQQVAAQQSVAPVAARRAQGELMAAE